ncbi:hypothetical protein Pmani_012856 [Petrolisthes manimaculis]|uniref:Peroxin-19 n=1 Tax=Petrolisthes manimaculis TaxID=1843537 RepID=A0AAE1PYJ2_9EUCA|nr:hypothetical protein Pmani_012856 [Petrolisthes manimaculis]
MSEGESGGNGMEEKKRKEQEVVPDPELDDLLDDALQDFTKPPPPMRPAAAAPPAPDLAATVAALGVNAAMAEGQQQQNQEQQGMVGGSMWTEEFIQQATSQFEQTMRAMMEQQQGLEKSQEGANAEKAPTATTTTSTTAAGDKSAEGLPPVDISSLSAQFAQFAEAAGQAATTAQSDANFTHCLADTLTQLSQNNQQLQSAPTPEDLGKMFEGLGLMGEGGGAEGEDGPLGGLLPMMQVMLEHILSKDVLYGPMKEITDKYPDWLADHRASLTEEEYQRYNSQYHVMSQVVGLYDEEGEGESEEAQGKRFEKIMTSMQKLQELGQPPKELVGDLGPFINFDPSGNPILPDLTAPSGAGGEGGGEAEGGGEQCCVM